VTATRTLCEWLLKTSYSDLPREVIAIAKERILDTVGVIEAGAVEPDGAGRIAGELARELGGTPIATVIGGGFKTSAPDAALANGTSAATLEYDDASTHTVCHYSGALVPAVLAVAEETRASGQDVLAAYVLAWEIGTRIGACLGGTYFFERGFHPVGIWPCLGTAAASAKLLSCNLEQARMALGIATSAAGSTKRAYGTHTKPLHSGNAARNGIIASMLAKKGFTSYPDTLDPDPAAPPRGPMSFSFPVTFSGEGNYDLAKATEGLGTVYNLSRQPVTTHFYPAATGTAVYIELALNMAKKHGFSADEIERVDVRATRDWITGMSVFLAPETAEQARFSGNFSIAVALLDGKAGLEQYRKERIHSLDVQQLMAKIHISELEGSDELTRRIHETGDVTKSGLGELAIKLRDGREFAESGEQPRGSGQLPLKRQDLIDKYRDCANRAIAASDVDRSIELIENLDKQADIQELMGLLAGRQKLE
jgi:2-methylcitrate dehydratase PrpD